MKFLLLREGLRSYFKRSFRALDYRSYRFFFIGQSVSLVGVWMQELAMGWLIYRLTGSATLLATVIFLQNVPLLLIGPYSGVLADRFSKRKILLLTQSVFAFFLAILCVLVFVELITVPLILLIAVCVGCVSAVDMPCRQSFVRELVGKDQDIGNAIALNAMVFHLARLVGPSIAGVIVAYASEAWCFLYTVVALYFCVFMISRIVPARERDHSHVKKIAAMVAFKEGITFVKKHRSMKYMIYFVSFVSAFGMVSNVLMPVYVKDFLAADSKILGLLMGLSGLGSLFSSSFLASRNNVSYRVTLVCLLVLVAGMGQIAMILFHSLPFACFTVMLTGFCFTLFFATSNSSVQILAGNKMNGRVMSLYVMAFKGVLPFGTLLAGFWAQHLGITYAFSLSGIACIAVALWFYMRMHKLGMHKSFKIASYEEEENSSIDANKNQDKNKNLDLKNEEGLLLKEEIRL